MRRLILDEGAFEFFRSFLKNGNYLGRAFADVIRPTDELITWIPNSVVEADLRDGFICAPEDADHDDDTPRPLSEITRNYLDESSDHVAIVESDPNFSVERLAQKVSVLSREIDLFWFTCRSNRNDEFAVQEGMKVNLFGYLRGGGHTREYVSEFLDAQFAFHGITALISTPMPMPASGSHVEPDIFVSLAPAVEHIAIRAYDDEGTVMWTRPGRPAPQWPNGPGVVSSRVEVHRGRDLKL